MNHPEYQEYVPHKNVTKVCAASPHYSLNEQVKLPVKLWQGNLDLMHFMHFNVPLVYRGPYVVTIHDLTLSMYPGSASKLKQILYKKVIKNAVQNARHIITVSDHTAMDVQRFLGAPSCPMTTIHNGVVPPKKSLTSDRILRDTYDLPATYLLYTGNWREHKNIPHLLKAFAQVTKTHPDAHLVLTGNPSTQGQQLIQILDIEAKVHTPGHVSEDHLNALYACARGFVFPSLYEGFGIPPLEAMSHGVPVATSDASSLQEVCGEAALYFAPTDTTTMARHMRTLLDESPTRDDLIEKGATRVQQFTWDRAAEDLVQVYTTLLQQQ